MAVNNAVRMALCIECCAVQEVPGSIPDCDALIASRSGPSLLSSGCSPTLYAEDVGGPGQAPTLSNIFKAQVVNFLPGLYCTSVYGSATENLLRHTNFMFFGKTVYLYHAFLNIYLLLIYL
jgi:hypothetical protein